MSRSTGGARAGAVGRPPPPGVGCHLKRELSSPRRKAAAGLTRLRGRRGYGGTGETRCGGLGWRRGSGWRRLAAACGRDRAGGWRRRWPASSAPGKKTCACSAPLALKRAAIRPLPPLLCRRSPSCPSSAACRRSASCLVRGLLRLGAVGVSPPAGGVQPGQPLQSSCRAAQAAASAPARPCAPCGPLRGGAEEDRQTRGPPQKWWPPLLHDGRSDPTRQG